MHAATYAAFLNELQGIEKDAGVRDVLKAGTKVVKALPDRASTAALKGLSKVHQVPGGKHAVNYVLDPQNTQDVAMSISNLSRFFKG